MWIGTRLAKLLAAALVALFPTVLLLRLFDPAGVPLDQEAFPTEFQGIAVAPDGTVYVGVPGYSRVYLYSPAGAFIRAIRVPSGGAEMDLDFDPAGALQVTAIKNLNRYTFSADGTTRQEKVQAWAPKHLERFVAGDGTVYAIGGSYMNPKVIRSGPGSPASVVVERAWYRDVRFGLRHIVAILVYLVITATLFSAFSARRGRWRSGRR